MHLRKINGQLTVLAFNSHFCCFINIIQHIYSNEPRVSGKDAINAYDAYKTEEKIFTDFIFNYMYITEHIDFCAGS